MSRLLEADRSQQLLLPRAVDEWVGPEHPARFVASFVSMLNLAELKIETPRGERGEAPWGPRLMLGVWLYGWMTNVRSTRKLEQACRDYMPFIWLTGHQTPDHNALWRFWKQNRETIKTLFKKLVKVAAGQNLIGLVLHALDGTKMECVSSMDTAWHRAQLEESLKRLDEIIAEQVKQMEQQEKQATGEVSLPAHLQDEQKRRAAIAETLTKLDEAGRDHIHPREEEARVMKGRGGLLFGYNAQAVVDEDSDLVVAASVVNAETDSGLLVPALLDVKDNIGANAATSIADKGYWSGEQLQRARNEKLPVLVDAQRESNNGEFAKSKFTYDAKHDLYVCPKGEKLKLQKTRKSSDPSVPFENKIYRCRNEDCPVRAQCTGSKDARTIKRGPHEDVLQENLRQIQLPENKGMQRRRGAAIERLFGQTKGNDGFRRFTVRSLEKVEAQWFLKMTAHNLRKLHGMWLAGRFSLEAMALTAKLG